jgi:F420-non-reducing hydrogenase iron-sulfur subunit
MRKMEKREHKKESDEFEPKIVAFLCNWCSYAGADLAGIGRYQYPPNIRVIRVPCSGRVDPLYILKALQNGADGVLVSGCHPGDCHYIEGNYFARRKFVILKNLLEFLGFEEGRVQFSWVSAAEGERFSQVVKEVTESVRKLGPARRMVKTLDIPADILKELEQSKKEDEALAGASSEHKGEAGV